MKLIFEPKVYVVGQQWVSWPATNEFLDDHGYGNWTTDSTSEEETLVELAGRTCYQSFKGGRGHDEHIRHLIEVGHGSCLEHAVFSLLLTGISRSLAIELLRHRAGVSPSMLSQRYVDGGEVPFVVPPDLHEPVRFAIRRREEGSFDYRDEELIRVGEAWLKHNESAHRTYKMTRDYLEKKAELAGMSGTEKKKFARQAARSSLPEAAETRIYLTLNARAARNIIEQRGNRHADPEIRILAGKVYSVLLPLAPNIFGDYEVEELKDGTREFKTQYRKV